LVLRQQRRLSGGTTWHAAGLVGQLRSSSNPTQLVRYSVDLYSRLEAETGQATGWKRCGSISVARTRERMVQLERNAALARSFGIEAEGISAKQAGGRYPPMPTRRPEGAGWAPRGRKANPPGLHPAP